MNTISVRPIGFNRQDGESFLRDQPLGKLSPLEIEFVRPVRRLAQQDESSIAHKRQEIIVVLSAPGQRLRDVTKSRRVIHVDSSARRGPAVPALHHRWFVKSLRKTGRLPGTIQGP